MEKEFVPYEIALELKQLGFDEICIGAYFPPSISKMKYPQYFYSNTGLMMGEDSCTAPLYQQAFRWFDENTAFQGFVIPSTKEGHFDWEILNLDTEEKTECEEYYYTRLEAELACIKKLIEIVKTK